MGVSTVLDNGKKIMWFDILVFLEVQEINLRDNMQGSKFDEYCIFL